jgi:hypothetical protein
MEFTTQEIDTMIEALDAWTTNSKVTSMLTGLMIGGLMGGEEGVSVTKRFMEGEDEKENQRKETASFLKAKLLRLRDKAIIAEAMQG